MFHTKAGVLDRIGQSFSLFMQAPIALVLPLAVFNIVMTLALPAIIFAFFPLTNIDTQNISVLISLVISLALVYVIIYITLLIPISSSIIKSTFDIIRQKPVNIQSNIAYGFSKL